MTEETKNPDETSGNKSFCSDLLKLFNINSWEQLLKIAESVKAPENIPCDSPDWSGDKEFDADDGWKVTIFYDCGELDFIDHFKAPNGEEIQFWDWPDEHPWRGYLINWSGTGDLQRLREL